MMDDLNPTTTVVPDPLRSPGAHALLALQSDVVVDADVA